jgi:hypothetical protein
MIFPKTDFLTKLLEDKEQQILQNDFSASSDNMGCPSESLTKPSRYEFWVAYNSLLRNQYLWPVASKKLKKMSCSKK